MSTTRRSSRTKTTIKIIPKSEPESDLEDTEISSASESEFEAEEEETKPTPAKKAVGKRKRSGSNEADTEPKPQKIKKEVTTRITKKTTRVKKENKNEGEGGEEVDEHKCEHRTDDEEDERDENDFKPKPTKKAARKATEGGKKVKKEETMVPFRARTIASKIWLGAHVSGAGGPQFAVENALKIGANSFALFLKSQRKWVSKDLEEGSVLAFAKNCKDWDYNASKRILPHGSYLINLAQPDPEKQKQAYDCFLDDLKRCERLGIGLYNFHPGSTLGKPRDEALSRIAAMLNKAHTETKFVKTVLENMAGQGNVIGSKLEDLRDIISQIHDKSRVGVCVDTCHTFAAGYDLRNQETFDSFWTQFEDVVGMKYLSAMHINDSKAPLGSNRDLHQNIGLGFLGLEAFRLVVNKKELEEIPLVLETPMTKDDTWAKEVELLEYLIGRDSTNPEVLQKAAELSKLGEIERNKMSESIDKKEATLKAKADKLAEREAKKATKLVKETKVKATRKPVQKRSTKKELLEDSSE